MYVLEKVLIKKRFQDLEIFLCWIFFILELVITCRFVAKLDKPKILCKNCVGAVNKSRPSGKIV
jgi:hypothetical protein